MEGYPPVLFPVSSPNLTAFLTFDDYTGIFGKSLVIRLCILCFLYFVFKEAHLDILGCNY